MDDHHHNLIRIAIVGVGFVGATFAYSLQLSGLATEIVLIDSNKEKAIGEAMDLNHAIPLTNPTRVWAGQFADCAGAAVTVISAGVAQKPGETRLDLVTRNVFILRQIIPQVVQHNHNGIILIATNPVDILSYAAWRISGLPWEMVIGSGTILDTARFRYLLSKHFGVDARSIHAYIIGEHGDSEVPVWSLANIAGMHLLDYCVTHHYDCDEMKRMEIFRQTREAAYEIIKLKGVTNFAIASGLTRIIEAIIRDQNTVLTLSTLVNEAYNLDNIYLSVPVVVGINGIKSILRLNLDEKELSGLQHSAIILRDYLEKAGLFAN
jgi:L-lactate dehydrogenase